MAHISYRTHGVCSRLIDIDINDETHVIENVTFHGGCAGNTQGVASLIRGMKAEDAIERLGGILCGFKSTSCPDQLASALSEYLAGK